MADNQPRNAAAKLVEDGIAYFSSLPAAERERLIEKQRARLTPEQRARYMRIWEDGEVGVPVDNIDDAS